MSNHLITSEPANEDTIQCLFFLPLVESCSINDLCTHVNNILKDLSEDYLWHRDEFKVFVPIIEDCSNTEAPKHLCSITCFGDNIEDEWFIVYLILEISKKYPQLIIHLKDNDGDFLLIEAANYLPSWANPGSTENRVFIHKNHIHFITEKLAGLNTKLELDEALNFIYEKPELTQASHSIEQAIRNRIGKYPEKIAENIHVAAVTLPSQIASLLILKPSLIAPIVDTYCNHDVIDAKYCKNIEFNDTVTVEVKFTKFLYAKLLHSKLIHYVQHYVRPHNDKKSVLGVKLTCGFHLIKQKASVTDIFSSKEYLKFLESLKHNGYFRNNIEGSKEYNCLLEKAKEYFSTLESPVASQTTHIISELMSTNDYENVSQELKDKYTIPSNYTGNSEDWLNIQADHLNDLLYTQYGKETKFKNDMSSERITNELSSFLKQSSDFEGIEPRVNEISDNDDIEFESDKFESCIEKMLNLLTTGNENNSQNSDDDDDEFEDDDFVDEADYNHCDDELKAKLQQDPQEHMQSAGAILSNIMKSIKEEKASSGPSSNLLHCIGVEKTEILDSDDD